MQSEKRILNFIKWWEKLPEICYYNREQYLTLTRVWAHKIQRRCQQHSKQAAGAHDCHSWPVFVCDKQKGWVRLLFSLLSPSLLRQGFT